MYRMISGSVDCSFKITTLTHAKAYFVLSLEISCQYVNIYHFEILVILQIEIDDYN